MNECQTTVGVRSLVQERLQDIEIEHKGERHPLCPAKGMMQSGVVAQTQIASKPDQGCVVTNGICCGGVHGIGAYGHWESPPWAGRAAIIWRHESPR